MSKLAAVLAMGLGLCLGGRVLAQESIITYPVILPASANSAPTQPAKAVGQVSPACCNAKPPCRDVKACGSTASPAGCNATEQCGEAKACASCAAKKPCHTCCLDKLKCWCCYRALPCGCCCYYCCECWSHVWAFFPPDRGCCGGGYAASGCPSGGCATGACASASCPSGGCSLPH